MNDDLTGMDSTWTGLDGQPVRGLGGKPVLGLRQSVDIRGPYHYLGVVPRLGNAPIIQNRAGQWCTAFCQASARCFNRPFDGILAYEVKLDFTGPRPSIWPAHDLDHLNEAVYE